MNKIRLITTDTKNNEWKKAVDNSDETYWLVYQNTEVKLTLDSLCEQVLFDFQKGFQPKSLILNNKEYVIPQSSATLEIVLPKERSDVLDLVFNESFDPYGRIFVYNIFGK